MARDFAGKIELDIRDSKPDWDAFLDTKAPQGAPNVLVILYDDTGQAAWSPYGGRIQMPTLDKLAQNGLVYSQPPVRCPALCPFRPVASPCACALPERTRTRSWPWVRRAKAPSIPNTASCCTWSAR